MTACSCIQARRSTIARDGFPRPEEVQAIAACPAHRLSLLLVRCGAGRVLAPAQDVAGLVAALGAGDQACRERAALGAGWYVRDVSIPAAPYGVELRELPPEPTVYARRPRHYTPPTCESDDWRTDATA